MYKVKTMIKSLGTSHLANIATKMNSKLTIITLTNKPINASLKTDNIRIKPSDKGNLSKNDFGPKILSLQSTFDFSKSYSLGQYNNPLIINAKHIPNNRDSIDDSEHFYLKKNIRTTPDSESNKKNKSHIDPGQRASQDKVQDYNIDHLENRFKEESHRISKKDVITGENRAGENYGQLHNREKESNAYSDDIIKELDQQTDKKTDRKDLSKSIHNPRNNNLFRRERFDDSIRQSNPKAYRQFRDIMQQTKPYKYYDTYTEVDPSQKYKNKNKSCVLEGDRFSLRDDKKKNKPPKSKTEAEKNDKKPATNTQETATNSKTKTDISKTKNKKAFIHYQIKEIADDRSRDKQTEHMNNKRRTDKQKDANVMKKKKNDADSNIKHHPKTSSLGLADINKSKRSDDNTKQ